VKVNQNFRGTTPSIFRVKSKTNKKPAGSNLDAENVELYIPSAVTSSNSTFST
jgi:hypothetical protein